ncbi:MAG: nucleotide exchange factor GrpE [bacterium]
MEDNQNIQPEQEMVPVDQLKRSLADYQNLKKEMAVKQVEWAKYGISNFLESFLPVYAHLETAISHIPNPEEPWAKGLVAVLKQLDQVLAEHGAKIINETNVAFDHSLHEVVSTVDGEQTGIVTNILSPGWELNGKVLIPAKVEVTK